ncbi:hypothetical protein LDENG_00055250 [Lucifuga dentata]|nr:hypothetical protein LDENG_00055250 [Lucifuga dentata]
MNLALIHDKLFIKTFWEKRIDSHCQQELSEEQRISRSALQRLREEWSERLETRNKHLKSFNDNYINKAKAVKSAE